MGCGKSELRLLETPTDLLRPNGRGISLAFLEELWLAVSSVWRLALAVKSITLLPLELPLLQAMRADVSVVAGSWLAVPSGMPGSRLSREKYGELPLVGMEAGATADRDIEQWDTS